jgi:hypothetical protein
MAVAAAVLIVGGLLLAFVMESGSHTSAVRPVSVPAADIGACASQTAGNGTCTTNPDGSLQLAPYDTGSFRNPTPSSGGGFPAGLTFILLGALLWATPIVASATLASRKGLSPGMGAFFGLVLGWLGFAIVWLKQSERAPLGISN